MHKDIKKIVYAPDFESALLRYREDKNFIRRIPPRNPPQDETASTTTTASTEP